MTQQIINNGTYEGDPSAESIRDAFNKTKANFSELYGFYFPLWQKINQSAFFEKIVNYMMGGTPPNQFNRFCFSSAPDIHESWGGLTRYEDMFTEMPYLTNKVKFHAIQGDIVNGGGTKNDFKAKLATLTTSYKASPALLPATGNHDFNAENGRLATVVLTQEDFYDTVLAGLVTSNSFVVDAAQPKGNYYYKDFATEKIRVIVLNQYLYPETLDGNNRLYTPYYPLNQYGLTANVCYGELQLNWLINYALNLPNSDYHVIIFSHEPLIAQGHNENDHCIIEILKAFVANTTINYVCPTENGISGYTITCDFSSINNFSGSLVACIFGHNHQTSNAVLPNSTIHSIGINSMQPTSGKNNRVISTPTEDLNDFFLIDKTERKIRIIRYGANLEVDQGVNFTGDRFIDTPLVY